MPNLPSLQLPRGVYSIDSFHPFTDVEEAALLGPAFRPFLKQTLPKMRPQGLTRNQSEYTMESHVIDPIIQHAKSAGLLACADPSHCWKMNVIKELNLHYYDAGVVIQTYPWSERTTWAQVAVAAETLGIDVFTGFQSWPPAQTLDRMAVYNLLAHRARHDKLRDDAKVRIRAWDQQYAEVFEAQEELSASAKEQKGIESAISLLSDDENDS